MSSIASMPLVFSSLSRLPIPDALKEAGWVRKRGAVHVARDAVAASRSAKVLAVLVQGAELH